MRRSARRSRRISPRAGLRTRLAKARWSSKLAVAAGFQAGGGSVVFEQRDGQVVGVAVGHHPGEAITVLADERVLGPREQALEPEPALFVGQGLERPGAVAAVEDRRAGDGPAVGADHAAGEVAVEPGQDDRAEVVGLAGLGR